LLTKLLNCSYLLDGAFCNVIGAVQCSHLFTQELTSNYVGCFEHFLLAPAVATYYSLAASIAFHLGIRVAVHCCTSLAVETVSVYSAAGLTGHWRTFILEILDFEVLCAFKASK
jgi:hypothetical protein